MDLESTRQDLKKIFDFLTDTVKQREIYIIYCSGYWGMEFRDIFLDENEANIKLQELSRKVLGIDDVNYDIRKIILKC